MHQSSCVHTPQQNGRVERKHRHIMDTARALRFQANIPIQYWGLCVKAAVYIINRLPSSVLEGHTPYEALYNTRNHINHLNVFGCQCYATNLVKHDKFAERANESVFMGYSETQKGYILLDLSTNIFFVNKDVQFRENVFPFSKKAPKVTVENNHMNIEQDAVQNSPLMNISTDHADMVPEDLLHAQNDACSNPDESGEDLLPQNHGIIQDGVSAQQLVADDTQAADTGGTQVNEHAKLDGLSEDINATS